MEITQKNSRSAKDTLALMRGMVKRYRDDMISYAPLAPLDVFKNISNLEWIEDRWNGEKAEVIKRPFYTMQGIGPGGDCDDKAIALASYLSLHAIEWRFVAVSRKKDKPLNHVYVEAKFGNDWFALDPTYSFNIPGYPMHNYEKRVY